MKSKSSYRLKNARLLLRTARRNTSDVCFKILWVRSLDFADFFSWFSNHTHLGHTRQNRTYRNCKGLLAGSCDWNDPSIVFTVFHSFKSCTNFLKSYRSVQTVTTLKTTVLNKTRRWTWVLLFTLHADRCCSKVS